MREACVGSGGPVKAKLLGKSKPRLAPILAAVALVVTLPACATSGYEALLLPAALTCADCPTVAVTRIVDGDTLDTTQGRLRLFGVDTPERGERCFREATDRLSGLAGS